MPDKQQDAAAGYQEQLAHTTALLQELVGHLQTAILIEDGAHNILLVNQLFCDLFQLRATPNMLAGTDSTAVLGQTQHLFAHPASYMQRMQQLMADGEKALVEELETADGRTLVRDYIPILLNGDHSHIWKFTDITAQKHADKEQHKQKRFYEQVLNKIPADIVVFNNRHEYLFANPVAIKDETVRQWLIGKTDYDYCQLRNRPQEIADTRRRRFETALQQKTQIEWEEQITRPDGNTEYHVRKLYPVLDENGEVDIVIGYGMNITVRKKAEQTVQISEQRFRELFDNSLSMICTHDLDGKILSANPSATKLLGYSAQELVGQQLDIIISEKYRKDFWAQYLRDIRQHGQSKGVMHVVTKQGITKYLLYENYLVASNGREPYVVGSAQDISERIYIQRALKRSEEKYRNIIDNMNLGFMEVDADQQIVYCNDRFCNMSGYTQQELLGKVPRKLFFQQADEVITEKFEQRRQGRSDAYELKAVDRYNNEQWWLISGAPLFNNKGEFHGTVGIFLDITQQKRQENELRVARRRAEAASQSKELFLANMSHEIRTPMNAIMGISKLMQKTSLTEQQRFYLGTIQTASDNLLIVINDILDFTKIEAGKIALENIGFELLPLINHLTYILKPKADEKGLALNMHVDEGIAKILLGDPYRLNQILTNILTNALKFTEKGSVSVDCRLVAQTNSGQQLLFTITDTGIGMSEVFLQQLFEKFSQEDETITRRYGGTGLGMSISKQLVELMGGHITVESKKGEGTVFSIYLSFKTGSITDLPKKKELKVNAPEIKGRRLLVADDNKLNRIVATTIIKQYGGTTDEAEDGEVAVQRVSDNSYDLVLMDVQMPGKDGLEATKAIRQGARKDIPIIALTASATSGEKEKCLEAGMNDYISKPFNEVEFIQTIVQWLQPATNSVAEGEQVYSPLYDLKKLEMLSGEHDDFLLKYLQMFINEVPPLAAEALNAWNNSDYKLIAALVHHIKPSIDDMGIIALKDDLAQIEKSAAASDADNILQPLLQKLEKTISAITADIKKRYGIRSQDDL